MKLKNILVAAIALLMAAGIPFLLPHMHDRYFFAADILSVVLAFACHWCIPAAPLVQFASLLGYHAYLKMRYLLFMNHGARALIAVIVLTFSYLVWETRAPLAREKMEKQKNQT